MGVVIQESSVERDDIKDPFSEVEISIFLDVLSNSF